MTFSTAGRTVKTPPLQSMTYLSVAANKLGSDVQVTLTQQNGQDLYTRTYNCSINDDDEISVPNDLNTRTVTMLRGICLLMKYPNSYAGDS